MMSVTELPVYLLLQRSTSFCNSVKNDLEEFIGTLDSDFAAINREVKIAPKLRRKSTFLDLPGSCTLDLKEFTRSKENVLRALRKNFAEMERKWNSEVTELRDWFIMNVESCLSKMQLQVTVTAEELNLEEPECEVEVCGEESSSSSSSLEIAIEPASPPTPRLFHSLNHPAVAGKKRVSFADIPAAKRRRNVPVKKTACVTATKTNKDKTTVNVSSIFSSAVSDSEQGMKNKTDWMSLSRAAEVAPSEPGLYEVKQSRAKNAAYIGHSDNLQNCLLQYCEGKSSRDKQKKQLENFIQRNKEEISVRYEVHFSPLSAKLSQKKKLEEFLKQHKKLPSQNYDI